MPPPAAPSNFGSSRARSTPPPTDSPPKNSAAASSLSSQPMPPRIRPPQIPFPRGFKLQTQLNHSRWEEFLKSCNKKWPHSRPSTLHTHCSFITFFSVPSAFSVSSVLNPFFFFQLSNLFQFPFSNF